MAQILELPHSNPGDDAATQEVKRRVWWTLYMVDRWNFVGLGLTRQIPDACKYPMPIYELDFHQPDYRNQTPNTSKRGLWAYMIDLANIFGKIQDLHRQHVSGELEGADFETEALHLAAELQGFAENLPPDLCLNMENLKWHAEHSLGRTFFALHLGFYHYSTLVHFQYLDIQMMRRFLAGRCKHHANTFSDLLKLPTEMPHCEAIYNIVGHMTVVSSSVLLYTLFFGNKEEEAETGGKFQDFDQTARLLAERWRHDGPPVHLSKGVHVVRGPQHLQNRQMNAQVSPAACSTDRGEAQ